jgi:uncharacterized low-complexity protein
MAQKNVKPLVIVLGATLGALGAVNVHAADSNPFALNSLSSGYMVEAAEGKCGEAKCGADKAKEAKCGEAKCGADKAAEHKCGEAKCGADKAAEAKCGEGKCGSDKAAEAKCGEGKCGGDKENPGADKGEKKGWFSRLFGG